MKKRKQKIFIFHFSLPKALTSLSVVSDSEASLSVVSDTEASTLFDVSN